MVTGHHGTNGKSDYWIVKVNALGNVDWQKSLGGKDDDEAHSIQLTPDGGYIVVGFSYSTDGDVTDHHGDNTYPDYWIVKLNSSGSAEWTKSLGGSLRDEAYSIVLTADGGYVVAGSSYSMDGDVAGLHGIVNDYWVVKLNASGNIIWEKTLGGGDEEDAVDIVPSSDGGYLVAGKSYSNNGDVTDHHGLTGYIGTNDSWIVKLDANGNIIARQSIGGTASDEAAAIQPSSDGRLCGSCYNALYRRRRDQR
jgi:hypothetical protein